MRDFFIIVAVVSPFLIFILYKLGVFRKKNGASFGTPVVSKEILKKLENVQLHDFEITPKGNRISSVVDIPQKAMSILDEAGEALYQIMGRHFPEWRDSSGGKLSLGKLDVLFIEPDGISEYSGIPYLILQGVRTAGTVVFGESRTFLLLPHYGGQVYWSLDYDLFWSYYNEGEHFFEYLNKQLPPENKWLEYVTLQDVHPHHSIEDAEMFGIIPEYARIRPQNLTPPTMLADFGMRKMTHEDMEKASIECRMFDGGVKLPEDLHTKEVLARLFPD